jgi:hypothetical protein
MVAVQESTDHSARRSEDLTASFPFPVLVEIPEIVTLQDEQHSRRYLKIISGVVSLSLVIVILIIHFFVIDLDVLWARIARYLVL